MYSAWARERGMRLEGAEQPPANRRYRWQATVTGFGALRTLRPESGLHVLEVPDGRGGYDRRRVRVTVTPEAPGPPARRAPRSSAATASAPPRSSATPSATGAPAASTPSSPAASTSSSSDTSTQGPSALDTTACATRSASCPSASAA